MGVTISHRQKLDSNQLIVSQKMAADNSEDRYPFGRKHRGLGVIINNVNFEKTTNMSARPGSKNDVRLLVKSLQLLGITEIEVKEDLKSLEMSVFMENLSQRDYSDYDCFVCIFLSHGSCANIGGHMVADVIFGTDSPVIISTLVEPFNKCSSLLNKPKVFIVQACRGYKASQAVDTGHAVEGVLPSTRMERSETTDVTAAAGESFNDKNDMEKMILLNPTCKDYVMYYSAQPLRVAFTNSQHGSFFILCLCKQIEASCARGGEIDFVRLMTRVNHDVAYSFTAKVKQAKHMQFCGCKQTPRISCCLTKKLIFPPSG